MTFVCCCLPSRSGITSKTGSVTQYLFWSLPKRELCRVCRRCRPGSSPDRSRKRRRCTALSMLATPTDTHKRHRARCQSGGRSSGSCPPQVVGLILAGSSGSVRKLSEVPTRSPVVGVGSGAGVRPREQLHAAGILQKRSVSVKVLGFCSVAFRTCPAARGRSLWAFPAPLPSNYTPAPVGSLWGCCALCEPVGMSH